MTLNAEPDHDRIYIKFKKRTGILACPLCELLDGVLTDNFNLQTKQGEKAYTKSLFQQKVQAELSFGEIEDFVLQKEGTSPTSDVISFIAKHNSN